LTSRELKKPWQKNGVSRGRNLAHAEATFCSAEHYLRGKNRKHPRETVDDHLRFQTKKELLRQTNLVPFGTIAMADAKVPVVNLVEMKPPILLRSPLQKNPSFKTTKNSSIIGKKDTIQQSSSFFLANTSEETGEVR
jgi:hypothetical protein